MKKYLIIALIVAFIASIMFVGTGCKEGTASAEEATDTGGEVEKQITIGVSMDTLDEQYWLVDVEGMEEEAAANNAEIVVLNATGDIKKQNEHIESLISQKVDAIICVPKDSSAILEAVKKCNEAGIPFIFNDRMVEDTEDAEVAYGVATDNYELAVEAAEWFVNYLGENGIKGKAAVFMGDLGDPNAIMRDDGYMDVIEENTDIVEEVAAKIPTEWNLEKALAGTQNALQANPDINIIFLASDYLIAPVRSGLEQNNKWIPRGEAGHVYILTFDGDTAGLQAIKDGYAEVNAVQNIKKTGVECVKAAIKLINGETLDEEYMMDPGFIVNVDNFDERGPDAWGYAGVE